jgi:hypothetical protein
MRRLQAAERLKPVHAGQPHVQEDYFHFTAGSAVERFLRGRHGLNFVALVLQNRGQRFADARFVIDNE